MKAGEQILCVQSINISWCKGIESQNKQAISIQLGLCYNSSFTLASLSHTDCALIGMLLLALAPALIKASFGPHYVEHQTRSHLWWAEEGIEGEKERNK